MVAKVIVHASHRAQAIKRMLEALDSFHIEGIKTNIRLQRNVIASEPFRLGKIDTDYLEGHIDQYI
jgi:acetyl-CoA carboxylase biotin carboxylase subunit